ncbi:MAG: DUF86 domain-containing protein [Bacteroidia bacterium]|nr:DUF86 domain-containing protein [Bacteroidia bacterium]
MLDSSKAIKSHTKGITSFVEFVGNRLVYRAVERELEIVAEALTKIRDENYDLEVRNKEKIIGLRNRIIHDYGNTNYEIIWGIVYLHIDNLILDIENEIKKIN